MSTCDRPHRWGGYRRIGPGATFARYCRRRACPAMETVSEGRVPRGYALTTTRHGQPFLRPVRAAA